MTADAPAMEAEDDRAGAKAERLVFERMRAALPPEYRLYPNVKWIGRTARHRGLRDGEADLVIAHPRGRCRDVRCPRNRGRSKCSSCHPRWHRPCGRCPRDAPVAFGSGGALSNAAGLECPEVGVPARLAVVPPSPHLEPRTSRHHDDGPVGQDGIKRQCAR